MASSMLTATSSWPRRMCAYGFGQCRVKISRSNNNPGHAYYVCPCRTRCVPWVGWRDEYHGESVANDHPPIAVNIGLRADVIRIDQSFRTLWTVANVLCIVVVILLFRM
ncbi:hypothetical protein CsSME_00045798 [Camellia sinensis var. sinensis]